MKKRLTILFALLAGAIVLASCSHQAGSTSVETKVSVSQAESTAITGAIMDADFVFTDEGVSFPLMSKLDDLVSHFGDDFEAHIAVSCAFEGNDKEIIYDGLSVYTNPIDGVDTIGEIIIIGPNYLTPRGVSVGLTRDEVVAIYGPGFDEQGVLVYTQSGIEGDMETPRLSFYFDEQDKVDSISFFIALYTQF